MTVFLSVATTAHAQLPDSLLLERIERCDLIGVDWHRMNDCYARIASRQNDPSICDNIKWSSKRLACKRQILYEDAFSVRDVFAVLPFYTFLIAFWYYFLFKPPRFQYAKAAASGAFLAATLLYSQVPESHLAFLQPLVSPLSLSVYGVMTYAPNWFSQADYVLRYVVAHALVYGLVLGIVLTDRRRLRAHAMFFAILAVLFSVWMHPQMDGVRQTVNAWYDTVTS